MLIETEGIVIKQNQYKEKDAMVSVLTKDGTVSFLARGILNPTSKNASACNLFSYSAFTLSSKQDKLTLTQGKQIRSSYSMYESLEKMAAMQLVAEAIIKCLDEENGSMYPYFMSLLNNLAADFDSRTCIAICLAQIIKNSGYGLEYNECVECGRKTDIVSFSFEKGGFVCARCQDKLQELSSPTFLKSYRYVFMVTPELMNHYKLSEAIAIKMIHEFCDYLKECFDIREFKALEIYDSCHETY